MATFNGHTDTNVFQERSEKLVATAASHAATAIENLRMREVLRIEAQRMKNRVASKRNNP